jgi:hypothetical protein
MEVKMPDMKPELEELLGAHTKGTEINFWIYIVFIRYFERHCEPRPPAGLSAAKKL